MKLAGLAGVVAVGMMLVGCASGAPAAKAPAPAGAPDLFARMESELAHAISSTTVTSAELPASARPEPKPEATAPSPEPAEAAAAPMRTWGTAPSSVDAQAAPLEHM